MNKILAILALLLPLQLSAFDPSDINGLQLCLESRFGDDLLNGSSLASAGQAVTKWKDRSSYHRDATNTGSGPFLFPSTMVEPNALRFYGTNYLGLSSVPITSSQTAWTVCSVWRVNSVQSNSTCFDITETALSASVLVRQMWNASAYALQTMVRDSGFVYNMSAFSDDLQAVKIVTSTRSGNTVSTRINGVLVSTASSNNIGSMYNGSYYATLGGVRNGYGFANAHSGDIMAVVCYDTALGSTDLDYIELYLALSYNVPLVSPTKIGTSPVVPLGSAGSGEEARILEPSVLADSSNYKMYYCGNATNGASLNMNWKVFLTTSLDGTNWTKAGAVVNGAWEPDAILVNGTYYMAYTKDTNYCIALATSSDGTNWTEAGIIISTNTSSWSKDGPREANLYYENGTFFCYYADTARAGGNYRIGLAYCTSTPTTPANWTCIPHPVFFANASPPRWNSGASTECPCVRYYADLPHPYLMTFIGYNTLNVVVNKTWRGGMAYADTPIGPWYEIQNNPVFTVGPNGSWNDRISAEATHMQIGTNLFIYYSGGKYNGSNQVGMAVMSMSSVSNLMR